MAASPKLQPSPPRPPRSNARFWLLAGVSGVCLMLGGLVAGAWLQHWVKR